MTDRLTEELPLVERVGEEVIGTSRTTEVRRLGDRYVLKELQKVGFLKKKPLETDDQYGRRRLERSVEIIKEEKRLADIAKDFIPSEVLTYPESYFVAKGNDGFPTPFKVQELSKGKTLRELGTKIMEKEVKNAMDLLVHASVICFLKTGKVFDIVGCVSGDRDIPLEEVVRHLHPMKYSTNVLVTEELRLAFIDARVGGGNLLVQLVSLMTLVGYYWNGVIRETEKIEIRKSTRVGI